MSAPPTSALSEKPLDSPLLMKSLSTKHATETLKRREPKMKYLLRKGYSHTSEPMSRTSVKTHKLKDMNTIAPKSNQAVVSENVATAHPKPRLELITTDPKCFAMDYMAPGFPVHEVVYAKSKRVMDIAICAFLLLLFGPIMLFATLMVKLTSKGPVLFRQVRVGRGGRLFWCYKFRSMFTDAEERKLEILHLNEMSGPVFKIKDDPRITPFGCFIRKFSIDEMPQLFNILKGDMSLVGPRPPIPSEVAQYTQYQKGRLAVTPGLTCIWQVSGRNQINFERWVELDLLYIETMSFWTDMKILSQTLPAVLRADGAQ